MLASANDVADCLAFVDGQVDDGFVSFATEGGELPGATPLEFIYQHTVPVGDIRVIVAGRATARGTQEDRSVRWSLSAPELIDLTWTDAKGAGAEAFLSRVEHRTGIVNKICWASPRLPATEAAAASSPMRATG